MSGLGKLTSFATGQVAWKLGTIGAGIVALVLSALLLSSYFETRSLTHQRDALAVEINDPQTGFIAKLAQAHTNTAQLQAGFEHQIVVMRAAAADNARVLASTRAALAAATATARANQNRVDTLMAAPPQGNTLQARITDVDNRIMQDLTHAQ